MRNTARFIAALAFGAALSSSRIAQADPPTFEAHPSLRDGLRVEACSAPGRCETWVQFAARPYRTFVGARMAPSGRFFYVWSKPDGRPREVDVFATPRREGQLAQRRGHWSPGAGGDLVWVARDRLWHRWGCGAACNIAQLYDVYGTTLASFVGQDAEASPDGRFAVIASEGEGTLLDLAQTTTRSFRAPEGLSFAWDIDWTDRDVAVWFDDDNTDPHGSESRRAVRLPITASATPAVEPAQPARPTRPMTVPPTRAPHVATPAALHAAPAVRRAPAAPVAAPRTPVRTPTLTRAATQPRLAVSRSR